MVVYDKLMLECGERKIVIEKGESFPLDSDEKLNECRTLMIARVDWPSNEPEGDVAVYEYNADDKKYYIATNYDTTDEIVDAISDDPLEAVGHAALEMLDWSLKHGDVGSVDKILKTYAKLAEGVSNLNEVAESINSIKRKYNID